MLLLYLTIFVLLLYIFLGFKTPRFAIITVPVVVSGLFAMAAMERLVYWEILSLLILPATLISILFNRHEADVYPWPKSLSKMILFFSACVALLVLFSILVSSIIGIYLSVFLGVVFCYYIGVGVTQRNATIVFVISTIGASVRQNLPLSMALQSASENIKYKHSQILRRISKWLVQGYSLAESIKRGFRKCPARITALIEAGEKTGQVPQILESIEADLLEKSSESKRLKPVYPAAYFAIVIIFLLVVTLWIVIGAVPKFIEVIRELAGAGLPRSTKILVQISNFLYFRYGWLIGILILMFIFLVSSLYIRVRSRPRRPQKPPLLSRIGDFIKWHLPILHWFENNYSTLQVVEVLKIYLKAGFTVNEAIRSTMDLDVNCCFRKRLKKWFEIVEAGGNVAQAAVQCGLANSLSWVFRQENPDNTIPLLEMLESVYRSNYSYKINLARFILLPSTTICLGLIVGFVAYSILSAMVAVIIQCASLV